MKVKEQFGTEPVSNVVITNIAALSRLAEVASKSMKECSLRARAEVEKQKQGQTHPTVSRFRLSLETRHQWLKIVSDIRTMGGKHICIHGADHGDVNHAVKRREQVKQATEQVKDMVTEDSVVRVE